MINRITPPRPGPTPHNQRGDLQSPHRADGPGRECLRANGIKLDPSPEQWARLRELAWQSMRYRNLFVRALWAQTTGHRVASNEDDKNGASKRVRREEKQELSGAAYSAAEREVQALWTRDGKRILAGAPLPQFRHATALSVRGHKNRAESGVRIVKEAGAYFADLQVQAQECDGGCWIRVKIKPGTEKDAMLAPLLDEMAAGRTPILKGTVIFAFTKGRMTLKLVYSVGRELPPIGDRVATLGPVSKDGRLLLRTETHTIDYTAARLNVINKCDQWDLIRRRVTCQIGRRKGAARKKREVIARMSIDDWLNTNLHQWSARTVGWLLTQGVGTLVLLDLGGGTWPCHQFEQYLKYKCESAGIEIRAAALEDQSTERAAKQRVTKERTKAVRLRAAVREIQHQRSGL